MEMGSTLSLTMRKKKFRCLFCTKSMSRLTSCRRNTQNATTSTCFKKTKQQESWGEGRGMTWKHTLNNWLSLQRTRQLGNIPMIVEICYHISNLDVSIKRHKLENNTRLWNSLQENGTLKKNNKKDEQRENSLRQIQHVFTKKRNKLQNNPPLQVINTRRSLKRNIPGTTTTSHERMAPPETSDGNVVVYETHNVHYMTQPKICVYNMYIIIYIWCLIYGLNLVHNLRLARCGSSFGNFNSSIKITGSFVQQLKTTREWG